jgi:hypothetical protein
MAALLVRAMAARMAGGAPGQAVGTGDAPNLLGPAAAQLQAANPDMILKQVQRIKQDIANLIPVLAFRIPAAARAISSTLKGLDSTLKELQTASATAQAVGGPLRMSAIPQPAPMPVGTGAPVPTEVPPNAGGPAIG